MNDGGGAASGAGDRRWRLPGIGVSVALVLVAVVLAVVGGGEDDGTPVAESPPQVVTPAELVELESTLGHEIYWAGERGPARIESSVEADGNVFVRYLPPGVAAGDPRSTYLTVGTYPVGDAQVAVRRAAAEAGAKIEAVSGGGIVFANPTSAGSVYLAYPDSELEIEVYDPRPGRSLALIRAGAIQPVGEG